MAQGISLISGSPLIGCPIVYSVLSEDYDSRRTFHRIIVRVYAKLETDADYTTFDFSTPVETKPNGQSFVTVASTFDISSALVAIADKYEYEANPTFPKRYPYIKFRVEAWDEWMIDGVVYPNRGVVNWPSNNNQSYDFYGYAFMGAWNDMERMGASVYGSGVEYLNLTYLSRKPNTSPEVVFKDVPFIYPVTFNPARSINDTDYLNGSNLFVSGAPTNGPKSDSSIQSLLGATTVGGHSIYVIDKPARSYVLRFINGMGCEESVHVTAFAKKEANIHTEKHTVARRETLKKFSRAITVKSDDYETWRFTSGPLDEDWVSWYVHEFLMAQVMWINVNNVWLPVHVLPEETTLLRDEEKASMMSVVFRVQLDINGSIK